VGRARIPDLPCHSFLKLLANIPGIGYSFSMHAITHPLLNTNLCAINAASAVVHAIALPVVSICDISIIRIIPGR
jgi:hypothetical protein